MIPGLIVLTRAPRFPHRTASAITRNEFPRLEIWWRDNDASAAMCDDMTELFKDKRGAIQINLQNRGGRCLRRGDARSTAPSISVSSKGLLEAGWPALLAIPARASVTEERFRVRTKHVKTGYSGKLTCAFRDYGIRPRSPAAIQLSPVLNSILANFYVRYCR
jgi:hypothetical protein